jgi:Flp pilus assembly protein TadG
MRYVFGSGKDRNAQTLVFFLLAWGTIMLLCGLAIDSGLLYLAKARMGRAVDGAALAAVGNFNRNTDPVTNRDDVALIMRNFAAANFTDLSGIGTTGGPSGGTSSTTTNASSGKSQTSYTYNFNDGTQDANGQYRRFVQVILNTGSGGNITSATCNSRCPVQTYFIGYATYAIGGRQNVKIGGYSGPSSLVDLKVSSSAVASRNPRLIMVVLDRSASMLQPGGGAFGLPQAVVQFLDFFDTSSDFIGIVSFGTSARVEMPLTTNFIYAATNVLFDAYAVATNSSQTNGVPGADPEEFTSNADYDSGYAATGVRRMKFGGQTAADEGIRLGMEQLMANSGFSDPDVVKYMVIFTDGKWNEMRTLVAAPGYTNVVNGPPTPSTTKVWLTNAASWNTTLTKDTNIIPVPTLMPVNDCTNALDDPGSIDDFAVLALNHQNDQFQSVDSSGYEPIKNPTATPTIGAPMTFTTNTWVGVNGTTNYYTRNLDVWLQPGATDYEYHGGSSTPTVHVSNYNSPNQHITIALNTGDSNVLVVPGYVVDGLLYDGIDLAYPDNPSIGLSGYPRYRNNNYQEAFMWPDDTTTLNTSSKIFAFTNSNSLERQLMFRNYPNLLTGFYVNRPDEPLSTQTEPLDDTTPATQRPLYGLGAYYPSAGFYWPFDLVGVDYDPTYALTNAIIDPDKTSPYQGLSRHASYSINMLSPAATPEWSGEWFYKSTSGAGISTTSGTGTTSISSLMATKADWEVGAPSWVTANFDIGGENVMTNESAHNTNLAVSVWRPSTFIGTSVSLSSISRTDPLNYTDGYVTDGAGNYYRNSMAWSGRPTHYFDFSQAKWVAIGDNHTKNTQFLPLCNWKCQEYAWHARDQGVTVYTVGYGQLVSPAQQVLLAQIANSTNTTAGNVQVYNGSAVTSYTAGLGTAITYNPSQPIGQQFYATNAANIITDFFQIGQAINAALTQ